MQRPCPTFQHQLALVLALWIVFLPLHLQLSGWAESPLLPQTPPGAESLPLFNAYNLEPFGYLTTWLMHLVAGFMILLTIDLRFEKYKFWKEFGCSFIVWTALMIAWEFLELMYGFRGSELDTLMDLTCGYTGSLFAGALLYTIDRYGD